MVQITFRSAGNTAICSLRYLPQQQRQHISRKSYPQEKLYKCQPGPGVLFQTYENQSPIFSQKVQFSLHRKKD